jgi:hypothetical protein
MIYRKKTKYRVYFDREKGDERKSLSEVKEECCLKCPERLVNVTGGCNDRRFYHRKLFVVCSNLNLGRETNWN